MARKVIRIELSVDGDDRPSQVLTAPPFKLRFDTSHLADGDHVLRIATVYEGGGREERRIPFTVDNVPGVLVEGLEDGDVVRGEVGLEIKVGDYQHPVRRTRRQSLLYVGSLLVVLGVVWAVFAMSPPAGQLVAAMAPPASRAATGAGQATPVDKALYTAGKKMFGQYCMSCHQANGRGVDDAFPPLAGNKNLEDLGLVVETVRTGKTGHVTVEGRSFDSTMPPIGSGFSAKEIAEVATYIRNSWGNSFGGVTVEQVKKHLAGGSQ